MLGRLVEAKDLKLEDLITSKIGAGYPSGIYNVIISQDGMVKVLRVIKR